MAKKYKYTQETGEQINIPIESIKKIDRLIQSGNTLYTSREDFIKNAVEVKLLELKMLKPVRKK